MNRIKQICVYCGSSSGNLQEYGEAAKNLARVFLENSIGLVYGGAAIGIMGTLADTMLSGGGTVTGVMPKALADREIAHKGLTRLLVVDSMHERKAVMAKLSDGFIAMPGGLGTLDEIFEVLTWSQLGLHHKPCGLLNVAGYYDHLTAFLDHAFGQGFLRHDPVSMLAVAPNPATLLERFAALS